MYKTLQRRLKALEQAAAQAGNYNLVIDGFRYVGGPDGYLKVPLPMTEKQWLAENGVNP